MRLYYNVSYWFQEGYPCHQHHVGCSVRGIRDLSALGMGMLLHPPAGLSRLLSLRHQYKLLDHLPAVASRPQKHARQNLTDGHGHRDRHYPVACPFHPQKAKHILPVRLVFRFSGCDLPKRGAY